MNILVKTFRKSLLVARFCSLINNFVVKREFQNSWVKWQNFVH